MALVVVVVVVVVVILIIIIIAIQKCQERSQHEIMCLSVALTRKLVNVVGAAIAIAIATTLATTYCAYQLLHILVLVLL